MEQETEQRAGTQPIVAAKAVGRNGAAPNTTAMAVADVAPGKVTARPARYASPWKIWLPIPILLLLLDATFNLYFWKIPKLSGPDADWGYQFLIDVHRAEQPKPAQTRRVVAFGSSVSISFDPYQVAGLLAASNPGDHLDVHRLMLPGVHPADYRLFWEGEIGRMQPDVAVFMVNLLDFLTSSNEKEMNPTLLAALPAWRTLAERGGKLTVSEKLDWALRGLSHLYRYGKVIRSSLQDHAKFGLQRLLGSASGRPYGVYKDGFTKPRFGVAVTPGAAIDFEYFIHPEWIRQRGEVQLTFATNGRQLKEIVETESGWKRVHLEIPAGRGHVLDVSADGFWNPRAAGDGSDVRLLGVQLRQPPAGAGLDGNRPPLRYPPFAPATVHELLRMGAATGAEFASKWNQLLNADDEFGRRLRVYREEKLAVRNRPFAVSKEYAELERVVGEFAKRQTQVVIVNTSDSPWIVGDYQDSTYYQGYLEFFSGLAKRYPNVQFADLRNALPAEDFNDWHHPSYIGAIKLGPKYAEIVQAAWRAPARP